MYSSAVRASYRLAAPAATAAARLLAPAPSGSPTAPRTVDHFECYTLDHPPHQAVPRHVYTRDQFDRALVPTKIGIVYRFCNPAEKEYQGQTTRIRNPAMHLTLYSVQVPATPTHTVVVSNQFGTSQTLTVRRAAWIGLPTSKNSEQPPPARAQPLQVLPGDRGTAASRVHRGAERPVAGRRRRCDRRRIFCNPTLKYVRGPPGRRDLIVDKTTHLVCYGLKAPAQGRSLLATNQFGTISLTAVRPDLLCVPSKKLSVTR